jgi:uncharacterized protein YxjI
MEMPAELAHDRFFVEQLVRPIINLYRVTPLAGGDQPVGPPVAFVRQKRMAMKEDIRFFADEQEQRELFRIKARRVIDVGGRYDVADAAGQPIGVLHKVFGRSLFRSTWRLLAPGEPEQELAVAQEKSLPLAVARRLVDFVPYVGEYIPIPYNFEILRGERVVGGLTRKFQLRDKYVLDLAGDPERAIDRRLAIALAVGLDTLQNR